MAFWSAHTSYSLANRILNGVSTSLAKTFSSAGVIFKCHIIAENEISVVVILEQYARSPSLCLFTVLPRFVVKHVKLVINVPALETSFGPLFSRLNTIQFSIDFA
jgi:hypothetical protein